jgi:hypothetical protein
MQIRTLAIAGAFALSSTLAFAQAGAGSGATVPEKSGTAVNGGGAAVGTSNGNMTTPSSRMTTGTAPSAGDASNQGAPAAGSAERMGNATSPGGTMKK